MTIRNCVAKDLMDRLAFAEQALQSHLLRLEIQKAAVSSAETKLNEVKAEIERRLKAADNWCGICGINCQSDHK